LLVAVLGAGSAPHVRVLTDGPLRNVHPSKRAVCRTVLHDVEDDLTPEERKDVLVIETKMQAWCNAAKGKNKTMCYYMGIGDAQSGTAGGVKREISSSFSRGINAKRLCSRLKKMDGQMCELKYEKEIDFNTVDFNKLKVKDLRKIMDDKGIACVGCAEKSDFIRSIKKYLGKDEM